MTVSLWQVTPTNAARRFNLFCIAPGRERHLASLEASSANLVHFRRALPLIAHAADMAEALRDCEALTDRLRFLQSPFLHEARLSLQALNAKIASEIGAVS